MAAMMNTGLTTLVFLLCSVITSYAGESCYDVSSFSYNYCPGECCSFDRSRCCPVRNKEEHVSGGLVAGLTIGAIILVVIMAVSACICRRRYYSGVIVHSQTAVVVGQSNTNSRSGMTVGYPPVHQAQPYGVYPQYPQGYPAAGYTQEPPSYATATQSEGGFVIPGYKA